MNRIHSVQIQSCNFGYQARYIAEYRMKCGVIGGMIGGVYKLPKWVSSNFDQDPTFQLEINDDHPYWVSEYC
jgi:hypothetical protein